MIIALITGLIIAAVLTVFALFSPYGYESLILPFPQFSNFIAIVAYDVIFVILYGGVFSMGEALFYVVFQSNIWESSVPFELMISLCCGLSHYGAFFFVLEAFWIPIILALISVILTFIYIRIKRKESLLEAAGARMGVGFGVAFHIIIIKYIRYYNLMTIK